MFAPIEAYITRQIEDHIENPRDDLTNYLLNVEVAGQKLAPEHIFGTIVLVLIAGIDTTWSAITSSIWHSASAPEDLKRLVNEPELMPFAIEEFLRFYAPVSMARLVKEDFDFHGCPMKKDDWILLGFPAANRDPAVFEDADKFIIDRKVNRHAAFGLGIHRCAGSNLARLELRVALEEFLKRYPKLRTGRSVGRDVVPGTGARCAQPAGAPSRSQGLDEQWPGGVRSTGPSSFSGQAQAFAATLDVGHPRASMSATSRGRESERSTGPSSVTKMSSSMRTPIPRYSSGTVRSLAWK
jgi:cytochrome P450